MQATKQVNLIETLAKIQQHGPTRVTIDRDYHAVPTDEALREFGIVPDVVFVRYDGWSLGAPSHLADIARNTWPGQWIGEFKI